MEPSPQVVLPLSIIFFAVKAVSLARSFTLFHFSLTFMNLHRFQRHPRRLQLRAASARHEAAAAAERQRSRDTEAEAYAQREVERDRNRETERQRDRTTERQRGGGRETEGQRGRTTERQRGREKRAREPERARSRETEKRLLRLSMTSSSTDSWSTSILHATCIIISSHQRWPFGRQEKAPNPNPSA